jgi:prepilin-type N-terminal cleavage/methylation domain-containing protein
MNPAATTKGKLAFTLVELIVVVAILLIILATAMPTHKGAKVKARETQCLSNVRQVSLGYILWASANTNLFPWEVSTNAGGSLELGENATAPEQFTPLAAYVRNPAVFVCPTDHARRPVNSYAGFSNTNLSYFISLDASLGLTPNPALALLAGDRHLSYGKQPASSGLFVITNFAALGWQAGFHGPATAPAGVLGFTDGHGEIVRSAALSGIFLRQGRATNRLVLP